MEHQRFQANSRKNILKRRSNAIGTGSETNLSSCINISCGQRAVFDIFDFLGQPESIMSRGARTRNQINEGRRHRIPIQAPYSHVCGGLVCEGLGRRRQRPQVPRCPPRSQGLWEPLAPPPREPRGTPKYKKNGFPSALRISFCQ